jgi:predicted house-cleaning noncanonical NTP pyrophosphatase (MazG superfamily)
LKKLQETIAKLDNAIKEEKRQTGVAANLAAAQKKNENPSRVSLRILQQDQQKNRASDGNDQQATKELGETGKKAMGSLMSAAGSMSKAEGSLGGKQAKPRRPSRAKPRSSCRKARAELDRQKQKLLEEIEKQVKAQVMENLAAMLERQKSVREATEAISPRLASGERQAMLRAKQLGTAENHIVSIASQTIELNRDDKVQRRASARDQERAEARRLHRRRSQCGKGDEKVIGNEKQVEKDLTALLETLKNSYKPSSKDGGGNCKSCNGNKNKLIGELKVIRMMQMQVNDDTKEADTAAHKAAVNAMSTQVKEQIGSVKDSQAQVQDAMDKLHHTVCPDCLKE